MKTWFLETLRNVFCWFQARCPHDSANVIYDILEGDAAGAGVKWCLRCGAARVHGSSAWRTIIRGPRRGGQMKATCPCGATLELDAAAESEPFKERSRPAALTPEELEALEFWLPDELPGSQYSQRMEKLARQALRKLGAGKETK